MSKFQKITDLNLFHLFLNKLLGQNLALKCFKHKIRVTPRSYTLNGEKVFPSFNNENGEYDLLKVRYNHMYLNGYIMDLSVEHNSAFFPCSPTIMREYKNAKKAKTLPKEITDKQYQEMFDKYIISVSEYDRDRYKEYEEEQKLEEKSSNLSTKELDELANKLFTEEQKQTIKDVFQQYFGVKETKVISINSRRKPK